MNETNKPGQDDRLRELLALPQAPAKLRARLRANLDTAPARQARRRFLALGGLLAGVLFAAFVLLAPAPGAAPAVVVAAYEDMLKDRGLRGILNSEHAQWLAANQVREPVDVNVELSKLCVLGDLRAKHLRLVNAELGRVNIFMYAAQQKGTRAQAEHGELEDQHWLLLEPRPGTVVIALYNAGAKRDRIARLVSEMFAAARPA